MKEQLRQALIVAITVLPAQAAMAGGTLPGIDITNQASATFNVGSTPLTESSNVATNTVAERLEVSVTWQDAANITVSPNDTDQVLTFQVTNNGNGSDDYTLTGLSTLSGDNFDPSLVNIYLDADADGIYNAGLDTLYSPGSNDPILATDVSLTVFLVNDIPGALADGDLGDSKISATSNTGTGTGTVVVGGGDGGVDAVVGTSGGLQSVTGTYIVSNVSVSVVKTATVSDPFGGSEPIPGATIRYSIVVTASGSGTAEGLVITDAIPANTAYEPGTITLNAGALTDGDDADVGDINITNANTVTVSLGNLTAASATQTVTFDVTIN